VNPEPDSRYPAGDGEFTSDTPIGQVAAALARRAPGEMVVETVTPRRPDAESVYELDIADGARARQLPAKATLATAAVGYGGYEIGQIAEWLGATGAAGQVAQAVYYGTAAAVPVMRFWFRHSIPEQWRARWNWSALGAAAWADVAVTAGPSWSLTAALTGGALWAGAKWHREHQPLTGPRPLAAPPPPPPLEIDRPDRATLIEQNWADRVDRGRKILAGSWLTQRTELPNATRWLIQTEPGSYVFDEIFARRGKVAAALNVGGSKIIVEPYSTDDDDENEGWAYLTVVTRDILKAGVHYTGPRYTITDEGQHLVPIGLYADGSGEAHYLAADSGGARSGLVTGDPGSGKTALLEAVAMALRASGRWRVLFGDGDPEGGSSPTLNEIAHWPGAGAQSALRQLRAMEDLIKVRSRLKKTITDVDGPELRPLTPDDLARKIRATREIRPCLGYPGYIWIIDELHRLVQDPFLQAEKFVPRLERILRIGRKYGVVVLAGTQSLLAGDYGGSTSLRAYLASTNAIIMRSTNRSEQHSLNGVKVAPGSLPKGGGYAFAVGQGRLALLRVAWSRDMADYADGFPEQPGDEFSETAITKHRPPEADSPEEALALQMTALRAWKAAVEAGEDPDDDDEDDPDNPAITAAPTAGAAAAAGAGGGAAIPAPLGAGSVTRIRPPAPQPAAVELTAREQSVLDVVERRPRRVWRTAEIAEALGVSLSVVSTALKTLLRAELVRQPDGVNGRYEATRPAPATPMTKPAAPAAGA
jgi:hypothetical protein